LIAILDSRLRFPNPNRGDRDGLLAIGGDLSVERLVMAYRSGIFPWTVDPITWWSPDPRAILELDDVHVPRSLRKMMRKRPFRVTVDQAFRAVMEGCAEPARGRRETWITPEFVEAYTRLHQAGHAHSLECWQDDRLVGGIYGVAIGGFFAGESMFHRVPDASKIALCRLAGRLRDRGFELFDIQMVTPITARLGGQEIERTEYLRRLVEAVSKPVRFG
jgi:leucyl/phenylalanyl-tRNA---protein transferase